MSLAQHFQRTVSVSDKEDTSTLESIDHIGLMETALEAEAASVLLETQMEVVDTQLFVEALSLESGELSGEALKWKALTEQTLDGRVRASFEADDKKSIWRRIIDAIKAFFKKIADSFKSFFSKVSKGITIIEARAGKIKKAADKLSGDPKTKDFDSDLFGKLGKGNKGPIGKDLAKDLVYLKNIVQEIVAVITASHKVADDYLKTLSDTAKSLPKIDKNPIATQVGALYKASSYKSISNNGKIFDIANFSLIEAKSSDELPGGGVVGYSTPSSMGIRSYASTQSNITAVKDRGKYGDIMTSFRALKAFTPHDRSKEGNVPTLDKDVIVNICDTSTEISKILFEHNKSVSSTNSKISSINKATDDLVAALEKHDGELDASQKAVVKDTIDFSKALTAVMLQMVMVVDQLGITILGSSLKYCEESIAKY